MHEAKRVPKRKLRHLPRGVLGRPQRAVFEGALEAGLEPEERSGAEVPASGMADIGRDRLEARCETTVPVSAECELELSVQPLDLMKLDLVLPLVLLRGRDRLTSYDLAGEGLVTDEDMHRIRKTCPRRCRYQPVEEDEVTSKPAMAGDVPITGRPRVVPARCVGRVEAMPLFPGFAELSFGCEDGEVDVAEVVRLTSSKGAEEHNAEERRVSCRLDELHETWPLS